MYNIGLSLSNVWFENKNNLLQNLCVLVSRGSRILKKVILYEKIWVENREA